MTLSPSLNPSLPRLSLANAHFVTPFLAVGGDLDMHDLPVALAERQDLEDVGITHVLDARWECDDSALWEDSEVAYLWHGIDDAGQAIARSWFDRVATWSTEALAEPGARLLTHCHMGINRGPSAGFVVLLAQGWDPVDAIEVIRGARPIAYVAYAEQALAWWHHRQGVDAATRRHDRARLRSWREQNPLDLHRVIADQRERGL